MSKQKIDKFNAENPDFQVEFFESTDMLQLLETTAMEGEASGGLAFIPKPIKKTGQWRGENQNSGKGNEGVKVQEPTLDGEEDENGHDENGHDENGHDENGQDENGQDENGQEPKIKIGDRVRIRSTGKEGIVTKINDNGMFEVSEITE